MKYLSLFSGIGGFELGIQQAYEIRHAHRSENGGKQKNKESNKGQGFLTKKGKSSGTEKGSNCKCSSNRTDERPLCIGFSEIDKYATAIYQSHFPTHHNYGDITKINADELPDFDLLVGGFPCQSFSIAGKRKGFNDTRGTLFFEIARILKAKQPRLFLLENVKGLLSHDNGATFATIISALTELRYDLQWQVLNSKNHGVPQNRERVFIVGHLRGTRRSEVFPFGEGNAGNTESQGEARSEGKWVRGNVASTLAARDYKGGGNLIQLNNPTHSNDRGNLLQLNIHIPEATREGYAIARKGDSINLAVPNSKTRRGRVGKGVAQTLDTGMQQHTLTEDMRIRRLTPTECERLQGFPDNWTNVCNTSDTQRYKCCGNAVTVNVIRDVMEKMV